MDRRATLLSIAMPPLVLASIALGYCLRLATAPRPTLADKVGEAVQVVRERYYGDVPDEKLERAIMEGLTNALDPYCEYFTRRDYQDFSDRMMTGKFFGVGIMVEEDRETGYINVVTPMEDTPAFAADILPGDLLVRVDGEDLKGKLLRDVVGKIKGPEGTKVTLSFVRKNKGVFDVTLTRAEIKIVAVKSKMLNDRIGYVRVSDFTEMMPQFDRAVADLNAKGMKALVLDLRFNGGGLLDSAVGLSDRFLPSGRLIVSTRGRLSPDHREVHAKDDASDVPDVPVVILTNSGTASASEIVAGCLRDHGRATIVGARTYGKGSVQTPIALSDKSRLKITTARYFTPSGSSVHREEGKKDYGIDPDFLVELTVEEYGAVREFWRQEVVVKGTGQKPKPPSDLQLEAALEVLNAKLDSRPAKVERRELSAVKKPNE